MENLSLFSPPGSQTDSSIALLWDKTDKKALGYTVIINGKEVAITKATDYTAEGLMPNTEYSISVRAELEEGGMLNSDIISVSTKAKPAVIDVTTYGAVGDGMTSCTRAIQQSIDSCPVGGMVYIPAGVFVSSALFLKSNMILYLDKGAKLLGSDNIADYPLRNYRFEGLETKCYSSLINTSFDSAERLFDITIAGDGVIDANGVSLRQQELKENKGKPGRAVCIRNADNVYMKDITVRQSPAWCVHTIYCHGVSLNNVKIHTRYDENGDIYDGIVNGDGFDPDSTSDVYVFNSLIASQDDCIAIKSGRNEEGRRVGIPSENIRITNCRFQSGLGVAVGSEMSGSVRNVLVQDCTFTDVFSIGSVKAPRGRGGVVENILFDCVTMTNRDPHYHDCEWFRGGINIDQFYSHKEFDVDAKEEFGEGTPVFCNITFRNAYVDTDGGNAIYLAGLPESPLENIRLENIKAKGKYGFKASNVRGLVLENVEVESAEDEPYMFKNVTDSSGNML